MKFSVHGGDDGWDSRNYLNIWVCRLQGFLGYASNPGCPSEMDGVVISSSVFGTINTEAPYHMGRTAVHEIGHWLGLKHIWGDSFCGDDLVEDTPRQGSFTKGCPEGKFLSSCDNAPLGDMYMNYMDFTDDACMNLFTIGQKQRMLAHFAPGGPRNSILSSKGLEKPWNLTTVPETKNLGLSFNLYPNPASSELHLSCDNMLIGDEVHIVGLNGNMIARQKILSNSQKIDIEKLHPGLYFLEIGKGSLHLRQRFVKL